MAKEVETRTGRCAAHGTVDATRETPKWGSRSSNSRSPRNGQAAAVPMPGMRPGRDRLMRTSQDGVLQLRHQQAKNGTICALSPTESARPSAVRNRRSSVGRDCRWLRSVMPFWAVRGPGWHLRRHPLRPQG